jgi:exodeoxyribonuclease V alpha subunit
MTTLTDEQQRAVELTFSDARMVLLTGGPGTGKSYVTRAIVQTHETMKRKVLLAAPTGKAARRLAESTGKEAKTIHRLLEFFPDEPLFEDEPDALPSGVRDFRRNAQNPLEAELVVIDEASMIDARLLRALLRACHADRTRIVLVGDADQLPPVGPGAPFQDLVASQQVPVARLTQIHRQAEGSRIVQNAYRVLRGDPSFFENVGGDFFCSECPNPKQAAEEVIAWVTERLAKERGFDPIRDIQVLTPQSGGPLGTEALSLRLQSLINPGQGGAKAAYGELRPGDRVIQTRNDYTRNVMNGEWGQVEALDSEFLRVDLGDRVVAYPRDEVRDLALAYALTVHRAQGSEYKAAVVVLHSSHAYMLSRTLLYTALTRGRQLVAVVGDALGAKRAVANVSANRRRTFLRQLLTR